MALRGYCLTFFVCFCLLLRLLAGFDFWYFNTSNAILFSIPLARLKTNEFNTKDPSNGDSYSYLMEVLTGVILSDGSLVKKYKNGGTYLKFSQSVIHTGYFMVVFNLFANQGLCNMTVPSVCNIKVKGKIFQYITFNTKSIAEWNNLYALWYKDGKKVIPDDKNLEEVLTPVSLANWHMGDGGWTKKGIHLATNAFTEEDVRRLIVVKSAVKILRNLF